MALAQHVRQEFPGEGSDVKIPAFLLKSLVVNYNKFSKIHTRVFGQTIGRYAVLIRMERAKESDVRAERRPLQTQG